MPAARKRSAPRRTRRGRACSYQGESDLADPCSESRRPHAAEWRMSIARHDVTLCTCSYPRCRACARLAETQPRDHGDPAHAPAAAGARGRHASARAAERDAMGLPRPREGPILGSTPMLVRDARSIAVTGRLPRTWRVLARVVSPAESAGDGLAAHLAVRFSHDVKQAAEVEPRSIADSRSAPATCGRRAGVPTVSVPRRSAGIGPS